MGRRAKPSTFAWDEFSTGKFKEVVKKLVEEGEVDKDRDDLNNFADDLASRFEKVLGRVPSATPQQIKTKLRSAHICNWLTSEGFKITHPKPKGPHSCSS